MTPTNIIDAGDVLVVGAGLAGLYTALKLCHRPVTLIASAGTRKGSSSFWAQGGIAAAIGSDDSPALHAEDTIKAGDGLVDETIAALLAHDAAERLQDLVDFGVPFNKDQNGDLALGREAAHQRNRIAGVSGDRAGREIMKCLGRLGESSPSINMLSGFNAYELAIEEGRVVGVFADTGKHPFGVTLIKARAVILACGGSGYLYATTTNPEFSNGAALAMAARAGATIADPEFVQFHPTAIHGMGDPAPLATEALRGVGAKLVNAQGEAFMSAYHADAEMAPRDIVARAVFDEIQKTGSVGLDLRGHIAETLDDRFPTVAAYCKEGGVDPRLSPIPVAPAAHYHMGGIKVDQNGRTSLPGLWACGECASTGAHGANRLASNSLLEALVFGARIAEHIDFTVPIRSASSPQPPKLAPNTTIQQVMPAMQKLRDCMARHVGVVRTREGLEEAFNQLLRLERIASGTPDLSNMVVTSLMITAAAYQREESRGSHFRSDFPQKSTIAERSTLTLDAARTIASRDYAFDFDAESHGKEKATDQLTA
jgi:L-aspartate oxidase